MQYHRVRLVDECDLPAGHDWMLVEHDERITLFIAEDALTPRCLEEAWAAYRLLTGPRHPRPTPVTIPRQQACLPLLNTA